MATTQTAAPSKRPSKGVLIRLAIYVPLLSFFGWRATDRALDEREAADTAFRTDLGVWLENPPGIIDLDDLEHAIPVQGEAFLSAPPGEEIGTETGGTETTGTTGTTSDTGTTTGTTGETGDDTTGDTGTTTGEPAPDPATTTTGTSAPP